MSVPFAVTSHEIDGGCVVTLSGELDVSTCQGLVDQLIGAPGSLVVLDLAGLTFMDSSGLGTIHAARRSMNVTGGSLVVCRPTPMVLRVLEITGLDTWVEDWNPVWAEGTSMEPA